MAFSIPRFSLSGMRKGRKKVSTHDRWVGRHQGVYFPAQHIQLSVLEDESGHSWKASYQMRVSHQLALRSQLSFHLVEFEATQFWQGSHEQGQG